MLHGSFTVPRWGCLVSLILLGGCAPTFEMVVPPKDNRCLLYVYRLKGHYSNHVLTIDHKDQGRIHRWRYVRRELPCNTYAVTTGTVQALHGYRPTGGLFVSLKLGEPAFVRYREEGFPPRYYLERMDHETAVKDLRQTRSAD
jgi:hypothetical protein